MCDEGFDSGGDIGGGEDISPDVGSDFGGDSGGDFGGDLASDDGVDLNNEKQPIQKSGSGLGRIGSAFIGGVESPSGFAQIAGELRAAPGAEDSYARLLQGTVNAGVQYSAEHAQVLNDLYGNPAGELQNERIAEAIREGADSAGRTETIETIPYDDIPLEGFQIFDGETEIDLTDPRLEGYGNLNDVPPEILGELKAEVADRAQSDNEANNDLKRQYQRRRLECR